MRFGNLNLGGVVFVDHLTKMEWARVLNDILRY